MPRLPYVGFWTATIALMIMAMCMAIPLWLGSKGDTSRTFYGLFYYIYCGATECSVDDKWPNSDNVRLEHRQWDVDIIIVPILTTISTCMCASAIFILQLLYCRCCKHIGNKTLVLFALVLLFCSGVSGMIGLFVSYYMVDEHYKDQTISGPDMFPWAVLFMTIAVVFIFISCVIHILVVCRWSKYRDHLYTKENWYINRSDEENSVKYLSKFGSGNAFREPSAYSFRDVGPRYVQDPSLTHERAFKKNNKFDKRFSKSSDNLEREYRSKPSLPFRRQGNSKKYHVFDKQTSRSYDDMIGKDSNSSEYTPKILRGSSMPDYINEEQSVLRESRYMKHSDAYASSSSLAGSYTALVISPSTRDSVTRLSRSDPLHLASSSRAFYE